MLGYILLFLFLLFIDASKISYNKKLVLSYIFIVIFTGIRYGIGYDYLTYVDIIKYEWYSLELIPAFFQWIANKTDSSLYFLLSSVFIYSFYFLGIKNASKDKMGSIFFFIGFPFLYFSSLSTIRQSMALAVIFYLITTRNSSKIKKILLLIIAFLSHRSALLCLLLLLPWHKLTRFSMIIMLLTSIVISSSLITIISNISIDNILYLQFIRYINEAEKFGGGSKTGLLVYFFTFLILCFYNKLVKYDKNMKLYIALTSLGASLYAIFSINPHVAERFCIFFWGVTMLIIPIIYRIFKLPRILYYFMCMLLFSYSIYIGHITSVTEGRSESAYYPYRTIILK